MVLLWRSGMEKYNILCCLYLPINSYQYRPYWLLQTVLVWRHKLLSTKYPVCSSHQSICAMLQCTTNCTHPVCSSHQSICTMLQCTTNCTHPVCSGHQSICTMLHCTTNCTHPACSSHQSICATLQHTTNYTLKLSSVRSKSPSLYVTCSNWSNSNCIQHFDTEQLRPSRTVKGNACSGQRGKNGSELSWNQLLVILLKKQFAAPSTALLWTARNDPP